MGLSPNDHLVTKVFNGSIDDTEVSVTTKNNILIYSITLLNATAAEAYLHVFDLALAAVTVGSTVPTFLIGVDAASQLHCLFPKPIQFTTGFVIASTTARDGSSAAIQEVTITYMDGNRVENS